MISRYWVHQKKIMSEKNKRSILIIENDAMILKGLTQRFKKRNMLVITAEDGYEGYVRACNETPDVIITETLLSSMSGFRLSRLLKYDQRYKKIRIVMITTNNLSTVNEMFDACGADRILRKPFRFKELMEAVSEEAEA